MNGENYLPWGKEKLSLNLDFHSIMTANWTNEELWYQVSIQQQAIHDEGDKWAGWPEEEMNEDG